MQTAWITVIGTISGAFIGALSSIVTGFLTGRRQVQLEREKQYQAREAEINKDTRLATAELVRGIAAAIQAILLITWKADRFGKLTENDILEYSKTLNELLPNILGSSVVVSALDKTMYDELAPLVQDVYGVDDLISTEIAKHEESPRETVESIASMYGQQGYYLYNELTQRVRGISGLVLPSMD